MECPFENNLVALRTEIAEAHLSNRVDEYCHTKHGFDKAVDLALRHVEGLLLGLLA